MLHLCRTSYSVGGDFGLEVYKENTGYLDKMRKLYTLLLKNFNQFVNMHNTIKA